jgi:calcineurin-like phosphoesterase family protein
MTIFFTSDTHFGDAPRLRVDKRPFASVTEMDRILVERWNETVAPDDEVWHLGDFAFGPPPERIAKLLGGLNGRKHLIIGNNDGPATVQQPGWASVQHYAEMTVEGKRLVLCHYPFRTWNKMGQGVIDLHGHSHGRLTPAPRQYDVGVDVWEFRPVTLGTILGTRRRSVPSRKAAAKSAAT